MFGITNTLKRVLKRVKIHLQMLADPLLAECSFDGVFAIFDENNQVISEALSYRVSADEPGVAILGGIHMGTSINS